MILVTGATGLIGRALIAQLQAASVKVRALSRHPDTAALPAGVEVMGGDAGDPKSLASALDGVQAAYLFAGGQFASQFAAAASRADLTRVVVTSGLDGAAAAVTQPLTAAGLDWVHLRPTMFAANALQDWGLMIRTEGTVRTPYPDAAAAPIHEADIAEVAATALLNGVASGQSYELTGPQSLTFREQVAVLADALGSDIALVQESPDKARQRMLADGLPEPIIDKLLTAWAVAVGRPATVTSAVEQITGHPPRSFAQWVTDHRDDFR